MRLLVTTHLAELWMVTSILVLSYRGTIVFRQYYDIYKIMIIQIKSSEVVAIEITRKDQAKSCKALDEKR